MNLLKTLMVLPLLFCSGYGYSIFDAQLLGGQRTATLTPDGGNKTTITGNEVQASVHLDPIPLVPIAFGLGVAVPSYTKGTTDFTFDTFKGEELSFEVMGWLPTPGVSISPFIKLGYVFSGTYEAKYKTVLAVDGTTTYKVSGTDIAVGLNWSPLPLLGFLLEVDKRMETLKADKVEIGGLSMAVTGNTKNDSLSVLLGVKVGI